MKSTSIISVLVFAIPIPLAATAIGTAQLTVSIFFPFPSSIPAGVSIGGTVGSSTIPCIAMMMGAATATCTPPTEQFIQQSVGPPAMQAVLMIDTGLQRAQAGPAPAVGNAFASSDAINSRTVTIGNANPFTVSSFAVDVVYDVSIDLMAQANERSTGQVQAFRVGGGGGGPFTDTFGPLLLTCDACGSKDDLETIFRRFTFDLPSMSFTQLSIQGVFANTSAQSTGIPEPLTMMLLVGGILMLCGVAALNRYRRASNPGLRFANSLQEEAEPGPQIRKT